MRYRLLTIVGAFLLCIPAFAFQGMPVHVELLPHTQTLVAGQPVVVTLKLSASRAELVDLGENRLKNIHLTVTDPSGQTTKLPILMYSGGIFGSFRLKPGQPYQQTLNLTPYIRADPLETGDHPSGEVIKMPPSYKPDWVGRYSITATVDPVANLSVTFEQAPPVIVTVGPKDDAKLRLVCENLVHQIQEKQGNWLQAEDELLGIYDPVAVPSLRALLNDRMLGDELIRALAGKGTAEAVDAIQTVLSSRDPSMAEAARKALQSIQSYSKDEVIRQRAADALRSIQTKPK